MISQLIAEPRLESGFLASKHIDSNHRQKPLSCSLLLTQGQRTISREHCNPGWNKLRRPPPTPLIYSGKILGIFTLRPSTEEHRGT